jgi:hypothetical protein
VINQLSDSHFHARLELVEMRVGVSRKLFVGSLLNNLTLMQNKEPLAVADGTKSVSNHYRGATLHCSVKRLLDNLLTFLIQGTCGLIKNKDLGVLDKCPSNCNTLLLTTGKLGAFKTTILVESIMELEGACLLLKLG